MFKYNEDERGKNIGFTGQSAIVRVTKTGDIEICVYNLPKEAIEKVAEVTGKRIHKFLGSQWVEFAKARDKSQVTLFAEDK